MSAWFDKEGRFFKKLFYYYYSYIIIRELIGIRTFDLLATSVGVFGLSGLDKLLCFMMVKELQQFISHLRKVFIKNNNLLYKII